METQTLLAFVRSLSTLFLNLIKSIIAPLIFATLVVGISGTGDIKQVGRIGVKSLIYFEIVTTIGTVHRAGGGEYYAGPAKAFRLRAVKQGDSTKQTAARKCQALSKESNEAS